MTHRSNRLGLLLAALLLWPGFGFAQAPVLSPDGATITAGGTGSLITSRGTWTFGSAELHNWDGSQLIGKQILLNDDWAAGGNGWAVQMAIANQGYLYARTGEQWYISFPGGWSTIAEALVIPQPGPPPPPLPTVKLLAVPTQVVVTWSCTNSTSSVGTNFETGGLTSGSRAFDTTAMEFSLTCVGPDGSVTSTATPSPVQ